MTLLLIKIWDVLLGKYIDKSKKNQVSKTSKGPTYRAKSRSWTS